MTLPSCSRCRFYAPLDPDKTRGHCRRFPPTVAVLTYTDKIDENGVAQICSAADTFRPTVSSYETCGEFRE